LTAFIVLALLIAAMIVNMRALERGARDNALAVGPEADLPPTLALTTFALGPLRGLIADGLWWRVVHHHDTGNFFETMQLTRWITFLQPKFPSVWAYHGWNLCYNVAYEFADPNARWQWIDRGIRLLRDEGLSYNPDDPIIRKELARIYFDRIGNRVDDAYKLYTWTWAQTVMKHLPEGSRREIELLAQAPATREDLLADTAVADLVDRSRDRDIDLTRPDVILSDSMWNDELKGTLSDVDFVPARQTLTAYAKAARLRADLKLDPRKMLLVDREYGPFDWRLPQAHAVYWLAENKTYAEYLAEGHKPDHMIRLAMHAAFQNGRLIHNAASGLFMTTNNLAIAGKIHDFYDYALEHRYSERLDQLHREFLEEAIGVLYSYNHPKAARTLFRHYEKDYMTPETHVPFEQFVVQQMSQLLGSTTSGDVRSIVNAALTQAYVWLATGDPRRASGYVRTAYLMWQQHQKRTEGKPGLQLPPFEELKAAAFTQVAQSDMGKALNTQSQELGGGASAVDKIEIEEEELYLGGHGESGHGLGEKRDGARGQHAEDSTQ